MLQCKNLFNFWGCFVGHTKFMGLSNIESYNIESKDSKNINVKIDSNIESKNRKNTRTTINLNIESKITKIDSNIESKSSMINSSLDSNIIKIDSKIESKFQKLDSIFKTFMLLSMLTTSIYASGFRLPEQSLNGTALNSAYIAGAYGADSTYYNPANMSLMRDNEHYEFELNGTLIFIPQFEFDTQNRDMGINVTGTGLSALGNGHFCELNAKSNKVNNTAQPNTPCYSQSVSGKANTTLQPVPKIFFKSRSYSLPLNLRMNYGFSFTTPSGLSMDWDGQGGGFLDDVSIAMLEFNPVVSIAWGDYVGFGAGFRAIYSFGSFNNTLYVPYSTSLNMGGLLGSVQTQGTTRVEQTSNASAWGFGYNLALSVKPFAGLDNFLKSTTFSATFRSNVHMDMQGSLSAKSYIYQGSGLTLVEGYIGMNADLELYADLPPILNVGIAQDFGNNRIEFVYERTFFGSAQIFEFGYKNQTFDKSNLTGSQTALNQVNPESMLGAADYSAVAYGNGWKDASAYRLGYTYFGKSYKLMASLAYDETPAPQGKFGIPDANAYMVGFGGRKRFFSNKLDLGFGYSLALKDNRKSFIVSRNGFGQLHLFTIAAKYLW